MSGFDFSGALRAGTGIGNAYQEGVAARQKTELEAQQRAQAEAARTAIGEALRTGDYSRAASIAYQNGQDETGKGLLEVSKLGYERADKATPAMANIAAGVAQRPYEERRSVIQALKPRLTAMGISPGEIDAFDPTDANLAALMGIEYSQEERVEDAQTAYGNETDRITATNPVVVGASLVTRTGEELYRSPEFKSFGLDENVYEIPGTSSDGFTTSLSQDQTFRRMIGVESNGQQFGKDGRPLTSSAGAVGIAQVMPGTAPEAAKLAGLPYDEYRYRNDPEYNLALGEAYFKAQVERYGGDLIKATAAYNAGPGNVDRAIARAAKTGGDWTQYLPGETRSYITKVHGQRQTSRSIRQVQQGVPKADKDGKDGNAANGGQGAVDTLDRAIATAGRLLQHPGMGAAVGSGFDPQSWGSWNPLTGETFGGTEARNFVAEVEALKSQVFLPMVQQLRGLGALSEAEGKKLTDAIGSLDIGMSETAFRASVERIIADLRTYRDRAAGGAATTATGGGYRIGQTATGPNGQKLVYTENGWVRK